MAVVGIEQWSGTIVLWPSFSTGMWTTITTYSLGELHIGTAPLFDPWRFFGVVTGVTPVFALFIA